MRASRRAWLVVGLLGSLSVGVLPAGARAQQLTFPADFDAGVLKEGLDKFRGTAEGRREEAALAGGEVRIVIETYESAENYGEAEVTSTDGDGNVTEVTVRIDRSDPGDADEVADTIKHELRHAEIFIEDGAGEEAAHDGLHDGTDASLNEFNRQLGGG